MVRTTADRCRELVELLDKGGRHRKGGSRSRTSRQDTSAWGLLRLSNDRGGRVVVTRRALSKLTWPGVWSNSCCGHPHPGETDVAAVHRRVREELGVEVTNVELLLTNFRYTATDPHGLVENEHWHVYSASSLTLPRCPELR
jgi:isopentenyldiphosphate isomerase